ncbi:MAG TPA: hypothetical protein DCZ02_02030, partial [Ruminococcaceae bacterium]|nr:hypothetical protein [Oscillospiraceae bacterium]
IYKWKFVIIITVLVSFLISIAYVELFQSYNAQVVIRYNDSSISRGKTLDEKDFDPYEIVSPDVITAVINDLSLEDTVDSIRSRVTINAVIPDAELTIKESKLKNGEDYEYLPNTFSVSYEGKVGSPEASSRDILDSLLQNYLAFYQENHAAQAYINDVSFDGDLGDYDYIEIAEIISNRIDSTISSLESYQLQDEEFRSPSTGLTFADIKSDYTHLQDYRISNLFADIYRGQITQNKPLLIEKYTERKENFELDQKDFEDRAELAKSRMDKFADANIDVPNSYNNSTDNNDDSLAIIDDVHSDTYGSRQLKTETTYDTLVENYVSYAKSANNAALDAEHCVSVIEKFSIEPDKTVNTTALTESIEEQIVDIKDEMAQLYVNLSKTIDDYNDKTAASHIDLLTGIQYYAAKSQGLYTIMIVAVGTALSIFFAIAYEMIKVYISTRRLYGTAER